MNPTITLPTTDEALLAFDQYLSQTERCYFLILGQGNQQQSLLQQSAQLSRNWRWTLHAPNPQPLYDRLLSLQRRPGVLPLLPAQLPHVLGLSLSYTNVICRLVTSVQNNAVSTAFILAESFHQP